MTVISLEGTSTATAIGATKISPTEAFESDRNVTVLSDEPRLSSATLSITIQHGVQKSKNVSFRPEYTHQVVGMDESWGPKYQPFQSVVDAEFKNLTEKQQQQQQEKQTQKKTTLLLHKSHLHHYKATHELGIHVHLSPSCQHCTVDIRRNPKKENTSIETSATTKQNTKEQEEPCPKRLRTDEDDNSNAENISNGQQVQKAVDMGAVQEEKEDGAEDNSLICNKLAKALPSIATADPSFIRTNEKGDNDNKSNDEMLENEDADGYLLKPIGRILEEYTIGSSSTSSFVIALADARESNGVLKYHNNVQRLALWYIENADDVDVSDESNGGYWKVLYVFQKHPKPNATSTTTKQGDHDTDEDDNYRYSLVGYMTLYHFISLFHKPEGGIIVRICQALLLPPYQGQGHGGRLIRALYKLAGGGLGSEGSDQNPDDKSSSVPSSHYKIVQINVEDPAPGFVALRNKTDSHYVFENLSRWNELDPNWPSQTMYRLFEPIMTGRTETETETETTNVDTIDIKSDIKSMLDDGDLFAPMSENDTMYASAISKLTIRQIQIVREILVLWKLSRYFDISELDGGSSPSDTSNTCGSGIEQGSSNNEEFQNMKSELFKKARLMIKRRLNKENRDELTSLPTKEEQKSQLSKLFAAESKHYMNIISSLKKKFVQQ